MEGWVDKNIHVRYHDSHDTLHMYTNAVSSVLNRVSCALHVLRKLMIPWAPCGNYDMANVIARGVIECGVDTVCSQT